MRRFAALTIIVLSIAMARTAHAQFETATVLGTVRDATGAVVPAATVTLTNTATGVSMTKDDERRRQLRILHRQSLDSI